MPLKSVVYRLLIYKENSTNCYFSIYLLGWETLVTLNDLDKTAAIYEIKRDESRYSITKLEEKVTSLLEAEKELKKYSLDLGKLSLRDM